MAHDINFLRHRRQALTKQQEQDQRYLRWSAATAASLFVVCLIVLGVRIFFTSSLANITQLQDQTRQNILSQENVERAFVLSYHKVDNLSKLFTQRQDKQEAIAFFSSFFGPDVLIKQIEFNGSEQILTFGLEADDVFVLEDVFEQLKSPQVTERFARVTPSNLRRTEDGKYQMTVAVVLHSAASRGDDV